MRVLILTPYGLYRRWPTTPDTTKMVTNGAPVTMAQLAAALPGHEVRIFDGNVYRPPLEEFVRLARWAEVLAINVMSSYAALNTELNVRFLRRVAPGRPIVLGGHHATFYADEWLARGVDAVVRREGELTLPDLVAAIARGGGLAQVAGVSWSDGGRARHNPDREFIADLDSLPLPRWDLVDWSGYNLFLRRRGAAACLETGRGCLHACQFCQVSPMWKRTHRWKSPGRVVEELRDLHGRGVRQLFVVDDDFGDQADVGRQHALYDAWEKSGLDFEWGTFLRPDYVLRNPDLVARGARLGMCYAWLGFETVSPGWLRTYAKGFSEPGDPLGHYREVYRILRRNHVMANGFLVVGYPGQTVSDMRESLSAFRTYCDYPVVTFYKPLKGTEGYRFCEEKGLLAKDTFYHDSQAVTVKGAEALLPAYNRFFLKLLADPSNLARCLVGPRLERDMLRAVYSWFGGSVVRNFSFDGVADWLALKTSRGETPQQLVDRLARKYLADSHVEALARPFV